jgi:hypothetical protein
MDDSLQRRAIWSAAPAAFSLLVGTFDFGFGAGDGSLRRAALFVARVAALVAAVGAAGLVYVTDGLPLCRRPVQSAGGAAVE